MIYLDNNATTRLNVDVAQRMLELSQTAFGNPGSRHVAGRKARQVLEDAREQIAALLRAHPDEVVFTAGGTEANNLAIQGLVGGRRGKLLAPRGEHPSVEAPLERRVAHGCERITLPLDSHGQLRESDLLSSDFEGAVLCTSLLAHNETGTVRSLHRLAERCREKQVPFHVDAVQAVGKIDVNFRVLAATTLALAAHKFHGPRGIGALLVRRGCRLIPQQLGGHQEQGIRAGTEAVILAAGMAQALELWHNQRETRTQHLQQLRDRLQSGLTERCAPIVVNGDPEQRLPNTLHIAFPGCEADALLVALDLAGICCSLGSACASGSTEPAPILMAMGLPSEVVQSSIRLSLSVDNTEEEIDIAIQRIGDVVSRLRGRMSAAN